MDMATHPIKNASKLARFVNAHDVAGVLRDVPDVYGPNDSLDVMSWEVDNGRVLLVIETIPATATAVRGWLGY